MGIGNGAHIHSQLDIYGELLDSAHLYHKYVGEFDEVYWEFLKEAAQHVSRQAGAGWRVRCGLGRLMGAGEASRAVADLAAHAEERRKQAAG